jgi:hypothetical protein
MVVGQAPVGGIDQHLDLWPAVQRQRGVRDEVVQQRGLARAGFATGEDVAVDDRDVDVLAELVDTDERRVEDGQPVADRRRGSVQAERREDRSRMSPYSRRGDIRALKTDHAAQVVSARQLISASPS